MNNRKKEKKETENRKIAYLYANKKYQQQEKKNTRDKEENCSIVLEYMNEIEQYIARETALEKGNKEFLIKSWTYPSISFCQSLF